MILYDNAAPIERLGRTWKPWTKQQLVAMAARLPLSKIEIALVSYSDIIRYVGSIAGMDHALAVAGGMDEKDVATFASVQQKSEIIGQLIDRVLGAFTSQEEGDPQPPLAETPKTGH